MILRKILGNFWIIWNLINNLGNKMDIGFNIIHKSNPNIFKEKFSIIQFLKDLMNGKKFHPDFAVYGLDSLLYYAEGRDEIAKYIRNILQDNANHLVAGNYIVQIVIEGDIKVVESDERPKVVYKNEEFHLYPVIGRVKRLDLKHFHAPLNLQS
ncbi:hypothetical protein DRJ04_09800 [Candidatus Aerophobetes bacterium]|uniref:DUF8076 domain-containing protein n=1 Tax=Aerophobetes bacterium TaxID=2030807 RepID=A0A662D733_UNCAE|nr:MAG: hypothetical protein DRJ04_09800 [Candidatus Aerophobetes bacterium]